MDPIHDRLVRIEGKLDLALTQQATDRVEAERLKTDMTWVKGGMAIVLTIILSAASWLAAQFFNKV